MFNGLLRKFWNRVSRGERAVFSPPVLIDENRFIGDNFWPQLYQVKAFTLVGDTNHTDPRLRFFFLSGRNIDAMVNSGVKNVFLEGSPKELLYLTDKEMLASVPPPPEDYDYEGLPIELIRDLKKQAYEAFCAECSRRGIKVYFCDDMDTKIDPQALRLKREFFEGARAAYVQKHGSGSGITKAFMMEYGISYRRWHPFKWRQYMNATRELLTAREDDSGIVENIRAQASEKGNVVFWGDGHFKDDERSIKTLLGVNNVVHVNLIGDEAAFIDHPPSSSPDFTFFIKTGSAHQLSARSKTMLERADKKGIEEDLRL